jgi:hypothetical protein
MRGFDCRFEDVARTLKNHRLSRRSALVQGAGGLAGGAAAMAGMHATAAQGAGATPETATGDKTMYLFVQSFQSGSITPSTSEFGTHTVTLEQGWGQTIYFGDRPSRDVGAAPTAAFLAGLGFEADNPPNAALIVETAPGETDVAVVELLNPTYDEATHTATYDIAVLANWQAAGGDFKEAPVDLDELAAEFGAAHLLIDDCADRSVLCFDAQGTLMGRLGLTGFCWRWADLGCIPCEPDYHDDSQPLSRTWEYWAGICNGTWAQCGGRCTADWNGWT